MRIRSLGHDVQILDAPIIRFLKFLACLLGGPIVALSHYPSRFTPRRNHYTASSCTSTNSGCQNIPVPPVLLLLHRAGSLALILLAGLCNASLASQAVYKELGRSEWGSQMTFQVVSVPSSE